MADKIILTGVALECHLGITAEERKNAQPVRVYLELRLDLSTPCKTDQFSSAVDYVEVRHALDAVARRREYNLVESLAESMAQEVLSRFPVPELLIRISKPLALAAFGVEDTAIELVRRKQ